MLNQESQFIKWNVLIALKTTNIMSLNINKKVLEKL